MVALLANAIRYSPPTGRVPIRIAADGGKALLSVSDQGPGMTEEESVRIFDWFYRIDEARNRSHGGVALGLPLVRSIIEAHGGTVGVTTAPGEGATFTILLP